MGKREAVLADASDIYNNLLADYISDENKIRKHSRNNFSDLSLHGYIHHNWFDNPNDKMLEGEKKKFGNLPYLLPEGYNEEIADLSSMPLLKVDKEELKKGKEVKTLTPKKTDSE